MPQTDQSPKVSTITVVRNGERYLAEAIRSILAQSLPPREIIVVDGQSEDQTATIARSFAEVRYLRQPDRGLANARNQGIEAAQGEWIAFLDHDDLWHPDKLAIQLGFMKQHPALLYTTTWMRFVVTEGAPPRPGFDPEAPRPGATPSTLVARRELFAKIGGFDPAYAIGCDADWFTRSRDHGSTYRSDPRGASFKTPP